MAAGGRALDDEARTYILDVFARLETLTFYEILGVPRGADKGAVKKAYFKLVRIVHPDRYFGADLGDLRHKLELVFARMTKAYETLTSETRAVYDASLPPEAAAPARGVSAKGTTPAAAPVDPETLARRKAAMEALGAHLAKSRGKVDELTQAAARAMASGDVATAAERYAEALRLAPNDAAVRARLDEARRLIAMRSRDAFRRQAIAEEQQGHWARAAAAWQRVVDLDPRDVEAALRLSAARSRAGGA